MKGKREARMSHEMALSGHLYASFVLRSSRPYARGHQTSLRVKVIDQMPLINFGWLSRRTARSSPFFSNLY